MSNWTWTPGAAGTQTVTVTATTPRGVTTSVSVEAPVAAATAAPAAFTLAMWSLTDNPSAGGDKLTLGIISLPNDNGSAITALEYRVDSGAGYGAVQTLSGTGMGDREITVLAGAAASVQVRAANAEGAGAWSDVKAATPTVAEGTAPLAIPDADWSLAPQPGDANQLRIVIGDDTTARNGNATLGFEYTKDGGSTWLTLPGWREEEEKLGPRTIPASVETTVSLRIVTDAGTGPASLPKTETPSSAAVAAATAPTSTQVTMRDGAAEGLDGVILVSTPGPFTVPAGQTAMTVELRTDGTRIINIPVGVTDWPVSTANSISPIVAGVLYQFDGQVNTDLQDGAVTMSGSLAYVAPTNGGAARVPNVTGDRLWSIIDQQDGTALLDARGHGYDGGSAMADLEYRVGSADPETGVVTAVSTWQSSGLDAASPASGVAGTGTLSTAQLLTFAQQLQPANGSVTLPASTFSAANYNPAGGGSYEWMTSRQKAAPGLRVFAMQIRAKNAVGPGRETAWKWAQVTNRPIATACTVGVQTPAGEGGEPVAATATSISSGDPSSHWDIVGGRLVLTLAGASAITIGDSYSLVFNDTSTMTVSIVAGRTVANVAELRTVIDLTSGTSFSGQTCWIRPGIYEVVTDTYNTANKFVTQPSQITFRSTDTAFPARLTGINILKSDIAGNLGNVRFLEVEFFRPQSIAFRGFEKSTDKRLFYARTGANFDMDDVIIEDCDFTSDFEHDADRTDFGASNVIQIDGAYISGSETRTSAVTIRGCEFRRIGAGVYASGQGPFLIRDNSFNATIDDPFIRQRPIDGYQFLNNHIGDGIQFQGRKHRDVAHSFAGLNEAVDYDRNGIVMGNTVAFGPLTMRCPSAQSGPFTRITGPATVSPAPLELRGRIYICDTRAGNVTINLPAASAFANETNSFSIMRMFDDTTTNIVTVNAAPGNNIGGASSITLTRQWDNFSPKLSGNGFTDWRRSYKTYDVVGWFGNNFRATDYSTLLAYNIISIYNAQQAFASLGADATDVALFRNTFLPVQPGEWDGDGVRDFYDGYLDPSEPFYEFAAGTLTADTFVSTQQDRYAVIRNVHAGIENSDPSVQPELLDNVRVNTTALLAANVSGWDNAPTATGDFFFPRTRAEVIAAARPVASSDADTLKAGALGVSSATDGWNFETGALNAQPQALPALAFPPQSGDSPLQPAIKINYDTPLKAGAGTATLRVLGGADVQTWTAAQADIQANYIRFTPSSPLTDGVEYEVLIPEGFALSRIDDAAAGAVAAGEYTFTARTGMQVNQIVRVDGTNTPVAAGLFTSDGLSLSAQQRVDTSIADYFFTSTDAYVVSVRVLKGTGVAAVTHTPRETGAAQSVSFNASTGAVVTSYGTAGVDFSVTDETTHWRLAMLIPALVGREGYYIDFHDDGPASGTLEYSEAGLMNVTALASIPAPSPADWAAAPPPPAGPSFADSLIEPDFSVAAFWGALDPGDDPLVDGWLVTPAKTYRADTSVVAYTVNAGDYTVVFDARVTSGGVGANIEAQFRNVNDGALTINWGRNGADGSSIGSAGVTRGAIDMGGGVVRCWAHYTVGVSGQRHMFDLPTSANVNNDVKNPGLFTGHLTTAQVEGLA